LHSATLALGKWRIGGGGERETEISTEKVIMKTPCKFQKPEKFDLT
jgi:hypothetical protein